MIPQTPSFIMHHQTNASPMRMQEEMPGNVSCSRLDLLLLLQHSRLAISSPLALDAMLRNPRMLRHLLER